MIFWVRSKPTWVRLIYSMEQQHWRTGRLQSKKTRVKTDMLRSIGKQSGESVESVCIWSRYTGCWNMCTWMGVKWDAWTVASMPLCDWCGWRCVTGCRNFIRASGRVMSMAFGCATRRECHWAARLVVDHHQIGCPLRRDTFDSVAKRPNVLCFHVEFYRFQHL